MANSDAASAAGEGVVFKVGKRSHVYVAYDDRNTHFPVVSSPTAFTRTNDKIMINGHAHTLYKSGLMNGGELTYLGTNNWTDKPIAGADNYVVLRPTRSMTRTQRALEDIDISWNGPRGANGFASSLPGAKKPRL